MLSGQAHWSSHDDLLTITSARIYDLASKVYIRLGYSLRENEGMSLYNDPPSNASRMFAQQTAKL